MGEMLMCYSRNNDTMVDPLGTTDGDLKAMRPLALSDTGSLPSNQCSAEIESSQPVLQTWEIQGKLRYIK